MTVARYTNLRAMAKMRAGQLPGPGDVDRQARAHPEHAAGQPARRRDARPAPGGRHRRVGHVRVLRVGARHARHARRRRHRRGHAQHRRRAGARPAQGAADRTRCNPSSGCGISPGGRTPTTTRPCSKKPPTAWPDSPTIRSVSSSRAGGCWRITRRSRRCGGCAPTCWARRIPHEGAWGAWREHRADPHRRSTGRVRCPFPHESAGGGRRLARCRPRRARRSGSISNSSRCGPVVPTRSCPVGCGRRCSRCGWSTNPSCWCSSRRTSWWRRWCAADGRVLVAPGTPELVDGGSQCGLEGRGSSCRSGFCASRAACSTHSTDGRGAIDSATTCRVWSATRFDRSMPWSGPTGLEGHRRAAPPRDCPAGPGAVARHLTRLSLALLDCAWKVRAARAIRQWTTDGSRLWVEAVRSGRGRACAGAGRRCRGRR